MNIQYYLKPPSSKKRIFTIDLNSKIYSLQQYLLHLEFIHDAISRELILPRYRSKKRRTIAWKFKKVSAGIMMRIFQVPVNINKMVEIGKFGIHPSKSIDAINQNNIHRTPHSLVNFKNH